jgi:hypothetical protein
VSTSADYVFRVSRSLAGVLTLAEEVVRKRAIWTASRAQWAFLLDVSSITEHPLPPLSATDASAALAFLLVVRLSLEATLHPSVW